MMRSIDFEANGRKLAVRAAVLDDTWKIAVFDGDKLATPAEYTVSCETYADSKHSIAFDDIVEELMNIARDDVVAGRVPLLP